MEKFISRKFTDFVFFLLGSLISINLVAQETVKAKVIVPVKKFESKIEAIEIGERVPDIIFRNVLNYAKKSVRLSEFKGKIVILDMWSTTCASCISAFPKVEKLQKEFKDEIQILLVNPHTDKYDSEARIKSVLRSLQTRTGYYPSLPMPIHDSILNYYFPHKTVPHYVWIDGDGKLLAISRAADLTRENIKAILVGSPTTISRKDDWSFDRNMPILVDGNGGEAGEFIYRTIFTGFRDGIGFASGIRINDEGYVHGIYMLNKPLRQYITEAFPDKLNNVTSSRVILEVSDPLKFEWDPGVEFRYCYDVSIPPVPREKFTITKYLQEDLKRYFNITVHTEKRKVKCMVVRKASDFSIPQTKYDQPDIVLESFSKSRYIRCYSINNILRILDQSQIPLIDESGVSNDLIDVEFSKDFNIQNLHSVILELRKVGFDVREEEREIEMVVISDK